MCRRVEVTFSQEGTRETRNVHSLEVLLDICCASVLGEMLSPSPVARR